MEGPKMTKIATAPGKTPDVWLADVVKTTEITETPCEEFNRLTALPLSQQTKKIQARIRKLGNLPENTGPREGATPELDKMTVSQLRSLAVERGLSTTTKLTRKAELIAAIEKATAKKTTAAAAQPAKNRCRSCSVRPIGKDDDSKSLEMCQPCRESADWENTHSDYAHAGLADGSLTWKDTTYKTKKAFDAWVEGERASMEKCWTCHPEMDRSKADYVAQTGTVRTGMVIHAHGDIAAKVAVLKDAGEAAGGKITVRHERNADKAVLSTTLVWTSSIGAKVTVVWDGRGRFQYGPSTAVGRISPDTPAKDKPRKIRNVSEALRFIATPA